MNQSVTDSEKRPCARHPQEETRLRCAECETPICPKCMVAYETGFKCPACAQKRASHLEQVEGRHYGIAGLGALLAGFLYGLLHPALLGLGFFRIFGVPVIGLLLAYFSGVWAGNFLHRQIRYKLSRRLVGLVIALCALGMLLTGPVQIQVLLALQALATAPQMGSNAFWFLLSRLGPVLMPVLFAAGLSRSFRGPR